MTQYRNMHVSMSAREHHYALGAASLLCSCRRRLRAVLDHDGNRHENFADLDVTLHATERLLHFYLLALVEGYELTNSSMVSGRILDGKDRDRGTETLAGTVKYLESLTERSRSQQQKGRLNSKARSARKAAASRGLQHNASSSTSLSKGRYGQYGSHHQVSERFHRAATSNSALDIRTVTRDGFRGGDRWGEQSAGDNSGGYSTPYVTTTVGAFGQRGFSSMNRSREDSLLFSLIVLLQLCQVRIEEADRILCGSENPKSHRKETIEDAVDSHSTPTGDSHGRHPRGRGTIVLFGLAAGVGTSLILHNQDPVSSPKESREEQKRLLFTTSKVTSGVLVASILRRGWRLLGMNARLTHSTTALEDWQHQWITVQATVKSSTISSIAASNREAGDTYTKAQSNELLELIEKQRSNSLVWHSYSALRFLFIKRTMDLLYASVGAAMEITNGSEGSRKSAKRYSKLWMPIATAAYWSYYSLMGPSTKSAEVVSASSQDLVKNAWGVISLPAVKHISIKASRILKGASIADRIEIAGVPCVVLSSAPFPALATALNRFRRQQERETPNLSTIIEDTITEDGAFGRRAVNVQDYPSRNIIFHLTGGGFFAHTLAGDLPYLFDWSRLTDSVIICPEYPLLPESCFPSAIDQISNLYKSLISGDVAPLIGFLPDRILITGEAAGGNLGAALCVKLCMKELLRNDSDACSYEENDSPPAGEAQFERSHQKHVASSSARIPDAIMLSCPMLNMGLELTPSRVRGTNDPVLPSGLIKTISDSYLPNAAGIDKVDPIASPYYAPDEILSLFPPTLICASNGDPLLDDSVDFNLRLKRLGVESDLKAVHNMPHAFWGLSSAGFPEAKEIMTECQNWIQMQMSRHRAGPDE